MFSTVSVTTSEGTFSFLCDNETRLEIVHPNGATGNLVGGAFAGFAETIPASGTLKLPSSRVKTLAYSGGNVTVTEAGTTDGATDRWTKATVVPVVITGYVGPMGLPYWREHDTWGTDTSTLTMRGARSAANTADRYDKTISLTGLSAISVTEAT